jgi:hypothetical protein
MKDEELRSRLERVRVVIVGLGEFYENQTYVEALDAVLDPENGVIAAKQAGWAIAHERANLLQALHAEIETLKIENKRLSERLSQAETELVSRGSDLGFGRY